MKLSIKSLGRGTVLLLGLSTSCQKEFLERTPTTMLRTSQYVPGARKIPKITIITW